MDSINQSQPSLPSKFVTLADLKEKWLEQKEIERKEKELQEQQRQEAKQNQQYHEVKPQPFHRGGRSEVRPNRNCFRDLGTNKEKEFRLVDSLSSGGDKKKSAEVGTGVGFENVEEKEKEKEKKKKKKKKTDEKPTVGKRGKQDKKIPKPVENEVLNEGTEQAPLKNRKEKEKVEDIEASGRTSNEGSTSGFEGKNKNLLEEVENKFGKFSMNDRRSDRFTRPCNGFRNSYRGHSDRRIARKHLDKQMVWVRKDGVSKS